MGVAVAAEAGPGAALPVSAHRPCGASDLLQFKPPTLEAPVQKKTQVILV